jgi:ribosomal protein L11 methyltransferase
MQYYEYTLTWADLNSADIEILSAELFALGCESAVEQGKSMQVYFPENLVDAVLQENLSRIANQFSVSISQLLLEDKNWNAEWEKDFQPVLVDGVCVVRAPFHPEISELINIVIEPKMSFGTGHHETTWLMLSEMASLNFEGKEVLDMGSGTGVLAIYAAKKGAVSVDAIDIDAWAYENCIENIERNHSPQVRTWMGGAELLGKNHYDIILANINRNILLKDIKLYTSVLKPGGFLMMSGFFQYELDLIQHEAAGCKLNFKTWQSRNDWAVVVFTKE